MPACFSRTWRKDAWTHATPLDPAGTCSRDVAREKLNTNLRDVLLRCLVSLMFLFWAATACSERPDAAAKRKNPEKVLHIDIHGPFGSLNPLDDLISGSGIVYRFLHSHLSC